MENIKTRHYMEEILTFFFIFFYFIKPWKKTIKLYILLGMSNVLKENQIMIHENNTMQSISNLQAQIIVKKSLKSLKKYKKLVRGRTTIFSLNPRLHISS